MLQDAQERETERQYKDGVLVLGGKGRSKSNAGGTVAELNACRIYPATAFFEAATIEMRPTFPAQWLSLEL